MRALTGLWVRLVQWERNGVNARTEFPSQVRMKLYARDVGIGLVIPTSNFDFRNSNPSTFFDAYNRDPSEYDTSCCPTINGRNYLALTVPLEDPHMTAPSSFRRQRQQLLAELALRAHVCGCWNDKNGLAFTYSKRQAYTCTPSSRLTLTTIVTTHDSGCNMVVGRRDLEPLPR
jgi:hypothetical protein